MKQLLICTPLLLFACTSKTENVSNQSLPFKERGINLMDSVTRQFEWNEQTLQIKYREREYSGKGYYAQSPILLSVDEEGKTIDSLQLFERRPYVGTDTYYLPWIEISKTGIVTRTDTSYYYAYRPLKNDSKEKIQAQEMYRERAIHVEKFKISPLGKFSKMR